MWAEILYPVATPHFPGQKEENGYMDCSCYQQQVVLDTMPLLINLEGGKLKLLFKELLDS